MKRLRGPLALVGACAALGLGVTGARGAVETTDYMGALDGGGSMGFDIKRTDHGKRVKHVFAEIQFTCEGGDPGTNVAFLDGSFRVAKDGTFGGRTSSTVQPFTDPRAQLRGRLTRHHRATGRIRVHGELDPSDQPGLKCDTGTVDWTAQKLEEH